MRIDLQYVHFKLSVTRGESNSKNPTKQNKTIRNACKLIGIGVAIVFSASAANEMFCFHFLRRFICEWFYFSFLFSQRLIYDVDTLAHNFNDTRQLIGIALYQIDLINRLIPFAFSLSRLIFCKLICLRLHKTDTHKFLFVCHKKWNILHTERGTQCGGAKLPPVNFLQIFFS